MALSELKNEALLLSRELISNEILEAVYIISPISGTITALNTAKGQNVLIGTTLASIYPLESSLQAHLYIPPEGVGFLEKRQSVHVRVSAFPFQKFGTVEGKVLSISHTPYQSSEMPGQLMEVLDPNRTYYKAAVQLDNQQISANGVNRKLQPGLALEADFMLEKRRIYEWLLAPIYSFTKKNT